jgi:hypothetical protein
MKYRPSRAPTRPQRVRLLRTVEEIHADLQARGDDGISGQVATALGCACLARITGSQRWTDTMLSSARDVADHAPVRGDEAATTRLLIAASGLRWDPLVFKA